MDVVESIEALRSVLLSAARSPTRVATIVPLAGRRLEGRVLRVGRDWIALRSADLADRHANRTPPRGEADWEALVPLRAIRSVRSEPGPADARRPGGADPDGRDPLRRIPMWRMLAELARRAVVAEVSTPAARVRGAVIGADPARLELATAHREEPTTVAVAQIVLVLVR